MFEEKEGGWISESPSQEMESDTSNGLNGSARAVAYCCPKHDIETPFLPSF